MWLLAAGWGTLAMLVFHGTLDAFFTQDDFFYLVAAEQPWPNRAMIAGAQPDYVRPLANYWLPVVNRALFGLDARAHHAVQLALLGITVLALFAATWRRFGSALAASCAVALYALCEAHQFTLGWTSGAADTIAALGLSLTLWALGERRERTRPGLVATMFSVALLAKESAAVLPVAFAGAVVAERLARRDADGRIESRDLRQLLWFAAPTMAFVIGWAVFTAGSGGVGRALAFDPARMATVLRHSVLLVHPTLDVGDRMPSLWLAVPLLMAAVSLALGGRAAVRDAMFALLLWALPATIFALTKRPPELQEYYGHFSVFGLALLTGQLVATGLTTLASRPTLLRSARAGLVGTVALYTVVAAARRLDDVAHDRSPALHMATYSRAAYEQIGAALVAHPAHEMHLVDVDETMWWAVGKGLMVEVFFPGVRTMFTAGDAGELPIDLVTGGERLVLRQVAPRRFAIVR